MNLVKPLHLFFTGKFLFLLLSALLFLSCKNKTKTDVAYFGGQIINPKSDKVYFYKNDELLDSSKLSVNNKFLIKLDKFSEGFYKFVHGNEYQNLYMEPSDSLLIRLNTWDFDESLVFSGKGAERNNFLINLFLINQKEDRSFNKFYKLNDSLFQLKIDSVLKLKNLLYSQFKAEVPENSVLFDKLVNAAINYPAYTKKEIYPYNNMKVLKSEKHPEINPIFFKFRKNINLDDEELIGFYPHESYVRAYLIHLAYEKQVLDSFKSDLDVNMMQAALENVKNETVKNKFLHIGIWYTLLNENTSLKEKERATRLFFDHSTDEKSVAAISNLIEVSKQLPKGKKIPDISPLNFENKIVELNKVIKNKNTVICTWPDDSSEMDNFAKRFNYLEKKYPNYLFIGLTSSYQEKEWKNLIKIKKLNKNSHYRIDKGIDWLDINFPRAIIIDKEGKVQNNLTHLANRSFEKQLKQLK
ncbi:hypothetical protein UMM65_09220 [Aureibaculum sp. 2210JD6-5]|uniref:TlpA family protein disulfide reductase n=1 Tax=Aureibaculum sp. 2210JD6-5 TaxID=3103957 RepID=UPI002AAE0517|nr:hypothetical protein [Aureibaculum sp. 2210JD6-5]MDY7395420.1 hypothetical protein [Aureibaculum sp. 2210JD6-5]